MPNFVDVIGSIFKGKNPIDSIDGIIKDFKVTPEDKIRMQEEADKVRQQWRDFEAAAIAADNANTASAREMNAKIQGDKPSWLAKNIGYLIDILLVVVWAILTFYIVGRALHIIDTEGKTVDFTTVLGIYAGVSTMCGTVVNFHRGSSQGSSDKQKTIDRLTQ
jgi:hypothetical protein